MRRSISRSLTLSLIIACCLCLGAPIVATTSFDAHAQGRRGKRANKSKANRGKADKNAKLKVFDFTGLDVAGQLRAPQLLYFLDRANEELQRASLERRSFIPEFVRSIDEEGL